MRSPTPFSQNHSGIRKLTRHQLYDRYRRIIPRVLRYRLNRYGVYFQRLIGYDHDDTYKNGINQLEHIIQTWYRGNHRKSALQAAIFDPRKDHTNQRMRGFPCLQQVAFAPQGVDGLMVTGLYATQYIFERAYGNYLGLCRLGQFMAHEMGKQLTQVNCVASSAQAGKRTKSFLNKLVGDVEEILGQFQEGKVREKLDLGRLIVFEGPDGVGKSTLAAKLTDRLRKTGVPCKYMAFPGRQPGSLGRLVYDLHHDAHGFGLNEFSPTSLQLLHIAGSCRRDRERGAARPP